MASSDSEPSLLVLILETTPKQWGLVSAAGGEAKAESAKPTFQQLVDALLVLVRAFHLCNAGNRVAVIGSDDRQRFVPLARSPLARSQTSKRTGGRQWRWLSGCSLRMCIGLLRNKMSDTQSVRARFHHIACAWPGWFAASLQCCLVCRFLSGWAAWARPRFWLNEPLQLVINCHWPITTGVSPVASFFSSLLL